jgi:hypothetical protein
MIVKEGAKGLYLEDTYWSNENRIFRSKEDAEKDGTLTYLGNLEDWDEAKEVDRQYYDDADFIELKIHAGYRNRYYTKKGATRSKDKMLATLDSKIEEAKVKIKSLDWSIERDEQIRQEIINGKLDVYI